MARPLIPNRDARRLFLHLHALSERPASLPDLFRQLAFVQLDSINTVARAHHMIIHARLPSYRPRDLDRLMKQRGVFEHWTHDASIIDMANYPYWQMRFDRSRDRLTQNWAERRPDFQDKIPHVLAQIRDKGPQSSSDVGADEARKSGGWWDWHPSKTALEFLWHTGDLAVCHRRGFRKYYDLPERIIPDDLRARVPGEAATINWAANAALDRLGFATSGEISRFFDKITATEARDWCAAELASGQLIEVDIESAEGTTRRAFARPDIADQIVAAPDAPGLVRIMSPFDPALRDRARTERLFNFFYRIEIFVPEAKRQYGYYVFPVLEGDRLIGRIDMKADKGVLTVTRFWPEPGVKLGKGRLAKLQTAIDRSRRLSGAETAVYNPNWLAT